MARKRVQVDVTTRADDKPQFLEIELPEEVPPVVFSDAPQVNTIETKLPRKIAIVGKATSSMMLAPYDDDSWEIWGLSDCFKFVPRLTRSYEIHDIETGKHRWKPEYLEWLKRNQGIVVIQDPHPELPKAMVLPWRELLNQAWSNYFTNSVSWMVAHALLEGVSELALYGVDMAQSNPGGSNGEYEHQRPSCEYFIGLAQGMGVKVTVAPQSDLLKANELYAIDSHKGEQYLWDQARVQELANRLNTLEAQERRLLRELEQTRINKGRMQGAIESDQYTARTRPRATTRGLRKPPEKPNA